MDKICPICGKQFPYKKYGGRVKQYCSVKCARVYYKTVFDTSARKITKEMIRTKIVKNWHDLPHK